MPDTVEEVFSAAMAACGPLGTAPRLAVAVSGGADSTALALLARDWVVPREGSVIALIVDHGLRPGSDREAALAAQRLSGQSIDSVSYRLSLTDGAALQERARAARYAVLTSAARENGAVHLLVGHHADDQAELIMMRAARGTRGLSGMSPISARNDVLLLRPLLALPHAALQDYLRARGVEWIEDPSNLDRRFERGRLRLAGQRVSSNEIAALIAHAMVARRLEQDAAAASLVASVCLYDAGFAHIAADRLDPNALAALLRVIGGADYPPPRASTVRIAKSLAPATLGGVALVLAKRPFEGFLLVREPAACAKPVPAMHRAQWDGRFVLDRVPETATAFGALGDHAAEIRDRSSLPAVVLRGLPAIFRNDKLLAVPHLDFGAPASVRFVPGWPVLVDTGFYAATGEGAG